MRLKVVDQLTFYKKLPLQILDSEQALQSESSRVLRMSVSNTEKEIQCVLHWFQSWSAMQKEDFLKDLLEKSDPSRISALFDAMDSLNVKDKPPSIFQCQLKLFSQWFETWTDKERNMLMMGLQEIDPQFLVAFNEELQKNGP